MTFDEVLKEPSDKQKILDYIDEIETEHPYHVYGRAETCNPYNEGWCDALNRLYSHIEGM